MTTRNTKLLGIFGNPLSHTLSPKIHSYFSEKCGLDTVYLAFELKKAEDLEQILPAMAKIGALGFNITAPYKIDVMKYLDFIDADAENMGAVNTIVNKNGKWYGYNTDGDGFVKSLENLVEDLTGKNVLILGTGGAAHSVAYKLAQNGVKLISFSARTQKKAKVIGEIILNNTDCMVSYEIDKNKKYDIIINSTPLGMHPYENENPFDEYMDMINSETICCDLIYNPEKTVFLANAEEKGAKILNGWGMFVYQAAYAYERFCDVKLSQEIINDAIKLLEE